MTISNNATFDIADQTPISASTTVVLQPPAGFGTGGRGRLIHPDLGTYDYVNTPSETVGLDGDVVSPPIWSHTMTIGGAVDTGWPAFLRDAHVIERWILGDVGSTIEHLRALWQMFANPSPDPVGSPLIWVPNYATNLQYVAILAGLRVGGENYRIDRRLLSYGYVPSPVELEIRVLSYA